MSLVVSVFSLVKEGLGGIEGREDRKGEGCRELLEKKTKTNLVNARTLKKKKKRHEETAVNFHRQSR